MKQISKNHFFFVRHAETDWNRLKLCQGQRDIPLNEEGMKKAKQFAESTLSLTFDCIVSSPLSRAMQTAKELHLIHKNAEFYLISELSERNWGELEGISSSEMHAIEEREDNDSSHTPGHQVESRDSFRKRVGQAIIHAQTIHPHPLIVSHGRVFTELCHLLGVPPVKQLSNCQLVKLIPHNRGWEIQHLT